LEELTLTTSCVDSELELYTKKLYITLPLGWVSAWTQSALPTALPTAAPWTTPPSTGLVASNSPVHFETLGATKFSEFVD